MKAASPANTIARRRARKRARARRRRSSSAAQPWTARPSTSWESSYRAASGPAADSTFRRMRFSGRHSTSSAAAMAASASGSRMALASSPAVRANFEPDSVTRLPKAAPARRVASRPCSRSSRCIAAARCSLTIVAGPPSRCVRVSTRRTGEPRSRSASHSRDITSCRYGVSMRRTAVEDEPAGPCRSRGARALSSSSSSTARTRGSSSSIPVGPAPPISPPRGERLDDRLPRRGLVQVVDAQVVVEQPRHRRLEAVQPGQRVLADRDQHVHRQVRVGHDARQLAGQVALALLGGW